VTRVIVDTGPLVAWLNRRESNHAWARTALDAIDPPLHTCEAVITEASFLLRNIHGGREALLELVARDFIKVDFHLRAELDAVSALMRKYAHVPIALADACLVRMTELEPGSTILTLDGDFRVYRRNRRHVIPTIMPTVG
jgi:predicted nucleic acid-binding protein